MKNNSYKKGGIVINPIIKKQILNKWNTISSFFKVVMRYPYDTICEKSPKYPISSKFLIILLLIFYLSFFIFYYKLALKNYIFSWTGTVERIEYQSSTPNMPNFGIIRILKDNSNEPILYELLENKISSKKIEKGSKVYKPAFYTEMLFNNDQISYSLMFSDFMFFLFGLLLFVFGLVVGGAFITIIFASLFFVTSKHSKA